MSKRHEIIEGRLAGILPTGLVYTEVLGWIDLGHAQGKDIIKLMEQINAGEASREEFYEVTYAQSMAAAFIRTGKFIRWRIKHGRTYVERKSIALAMMMSLARRFEAYQGAFPINLVTDSGFSGEDLVSDLLGFYRIMAIRNPFHMLRPVSKEEALKRWDYYGRIGSFKNETFRPLLFPDPEKFPRSQPRFGQLPAFMNSIHPYSNFSSGNVIIVSADGNYLQGSRGKARL